MPQKPPFVPNPNAGQIIEAQPTRGIAATNLTPEMKARATANNFAIVEEGRGPYTVTRMISTLVESDDEARRRAQQLLNGGRFGTIKVYRPFRANTKPDGTDLSTHHGADGTRFAAAIPCSPNRCFGPTAIEWRKAAATCARNRRVGIIDTGIDLRHPTFQGRSIVVQPFRSAGAKPVSNWHGTGVLALMAGDPNTGTPGLIPDASFYVADVFYADDSGLPATDSVRLAQALEWMYQNRVQVVNLSVSGPHDAIVKALIRDLGAKGMVFAAAAGNDGLLGPPSYPAKYPEVIAVTAVSQSRQVYRQATRGDYIDVAAPGVAIWTAVPGHREGFVTGTSFAVPFVTAALASLYRDDRPTTKTAMVRQLRPLDLGAAGRDRIYGEGLIRGPQQCNDGGSRQRVTDGGSTWGTTVTRHAAPLPTAAADRRGAPTASEASGGSATFGGPFMSYSGN